MEEFMSVNIQTPEGLIKISGDKVTTSNIIAALGYTPADETHTHDDKYYTENEVDTKIDDINSTILSHTDNTTIHITSDERIAWNSSYSHSTSAHAPSNAERNIVVGVQKNGTDLTVDSSTRKVNITVPTTAAEIGAATTTHNHDSAYDVKGSAIVALAEAQEHTNTTISSHNTSTTAHSDIRELISTLSTKVNNFLDVDDATTDELSEIIELINNNKGTLESLTSSKVNVADIVDNLTTASTSKVLSANQGVVLKSLIDSLQEAMIGKSLEGLTIYPSYGTTNIIAETGAEIFNDYRDRTFNDTGEVVAGNVAYHEYSHAEGCGTTAFGYASHAEGSCTKASGSYSHAEGYNTNASSDGSHVEGTNTMAYGNSTHAEGYKTTALNDYAHAEGHWTTASGEGSHTEGYLTKASGNYSHTEGWQTEASNSYSHAEGQDTKAVGGASHAEGAGTTASGSQSHAEGAGTTASGSNSHAEGYNTTVTNDATITAQSTDSTIAGYCGHAEGYGTVAYGHSAHAEGNGTTAFGNYSHSEGVGTTASGNQSHAEGAGTTALGNSSHAEGESTEASNSSSHAEGYNTTASGYASHAEGMNTTASGDYSHVEGMGTTASGEGSHAGGHFTIANKYQYVIGKYNANTTAPTNLSDTTTSAGLFIVGIGTSDSDRKNGFRINPAGKVYGTGTFGNTGADYAEYFEWFDGNPNNEDRRGHFVTLEGDKIRYATANDDYILGVVSANPSVAGDIYSEDWHNRYLKDVFGSKIVEVVEVKETTNENGEIIPAHIERRWVLNPDYNPDAKYVSREERPEWAAIGIVGKLVVVDDGTCQVNGYCYPNANGIATASQERTNYRVMERLDDTHIKIFIR